MQTKKQKEFVHGREGRASENVCVCVCVNWCARQREVEAQLLAFERLVGRPPVFLDGHQHVHVLDGVADIVAQVRKAAAIAPPPSAVIIRARAELSARFGVLRTRIPEDAHLTGRVPVPLPELPALEFYQRVCADAVRARAVYERHGVHGADWFVGMTLGGRATATDVRAVLGAVPVGCSVEWMAHPGRLPGSFDAFDCSPDRESELAVLTEPALAQWLHARFALARCTAQ